MAKPASGTFQEIIHHLIGSKAGQSTPAKIPIIDQFIPEDTSRIGIARNCNAAFLIALSGKNHPLHDKALSYLTNAADEAQSRDLARFYLEGVNLIHQEISR